MQQAPSPFASGPGGGPGAGPGAGPGQGDDPLMIVAQHLMAAMDVLGQLMGMPPSGGPGAGPGGPPPPGGPGAPPPDNDLDGM